MVQKNHVNIVTCQVLAAPRHAAPRLLDPAVPSLGEHGKHYQCFIRMVLGPGLTLLPGNSGMDTWITAVVDGCRPEREVARYPYPASQL
ncbi:hypothetical protein FOA52_008630 [Chlamydomonas sp. UWO 241]|nr:hypothetical protein FOA52_008630 [Chlamydomonas sp. UWO 241]